MKTRDLSRVFTRHKENNIKPYQVRLLLQSAQWHALGTLRSEDGNGRENVAEKVNSCSFNLLCDYSKSLTLSNVGEPS